MNHSLDVVVDGDDGVVPPVFSTTDHVVLVENQLLETVLKAWVLLRRS